MRHLAATTAQSRRMRFLAPGPMRFRVATPAHFLWPGPALLLAFFLALGFALMLVTPARADLGFEPGRDADDALQGWSFRPGDASSISTDTRFAEEGTQSLRVVAREPGATVRLSRRVERRGIDGDRIRVGAFARSAEPGARPSLWIRVRGPRGLIYIDRVSLAPSATDRWQHFTLDAPLSALAQEISLGVDFGGRGTIWLDGFSIEPLSAADLPASAPAALAYVDRALAIIEQHSLQRAQIDWPALRDSVYLQARGARDVEGAHLAVSFALGELDDGHSYFMSPPQMSRLVTPVSNARTGQPVRAPTGALLDAAPGDAATERPLAYLDVPGFAGGGQHAQAEFADRLQGIIRGLDASGACGWVVDLRENRGGNLWPMLVGLGPLLGEGEAGAAVYPDSSRRSFWYRDGKAGLGDYVQLRVNSPYELGRSAPPVAVLTGGSTASAAEILAAAFRAEDNARSFGAPTRGAHTSTRVFPLSDGAALVLAVAATSNRRGEIFTGPIAPDEGVASERRASADASPGRDPVVAAASRWLAARSECSVRSRSPSGG